MCQLGSSMLEDIDTFSDMHTVQCILGIQLCAQMRTVSATYIYTQIAAFTHTSANAVHHSEQFTCIRKCTWLQRLLTVFRPL
jgi:hypothetical protein